MKTRVIVEKEVKQFHDSLAPEPRRALRAGLHALEKDKGDVKRLEDKLDGFWRLRVGSYRVIFQIGFERGQRTAICVFAEHRSVVYELAAARLVRPGE